MRRCKALVVYMRATVEVVLLTRFLAKYGGFVCSDLFFGITGIFVDGRLSGRFTRDFKLLTDGFGRDVGQGLLKAIGGILERLPRVYRRLRGILYVGVRLLGLLNGFPFMYFVILFVIRSLRIVSMLFRSKLRV